MRDALAVYLKGFCMGAADMVPGVSGGTIALITGIYDRLVGALAALHPGPLARLRRPHDATARSAFVADLWRMDVPFLLVLGAGIVTAVVVAAEVLTVALTAYESPTMGFFTGLIAASAILIGRDIHWTSRRAVAAAVAATVAVAVATITVSAATPGLAFVAIAGTIAISAMVLPGLSGALLLIILGQYEYLLGELRGFLNALAGLPVGGSTTPVVDHGVVVVAFLGGAVVGLFTVAHAVDRALSRDRHTTLAVLVGLMAGGVYPPAVTAIGGVSGAGVSAPLVVAAAVVGVAVIVLFDRATGDLSYVEA